MKWEPTVPNILTISRILFIPVLLYLIHLNSFESLAAASLVFILSALTDAADGFIARKFNQQSEFGAFIDPLADKFFIWGIYIIFSLNYSLKIPLLLILPIIVRDWGVTFLRIHAGKKNIKFKTSLIAKTKTAVQMIIAFLIIFYMTVSKFLQQYYSMPENIEYPSLWKNIIPEYSSLIATLPFFLTLLTVVFTIYTGMDYWITYQKEKKFRRNQNHA